MHLINPPDSRVDLKTMNSLCVKRLPTSYNSMPKRTSGLSDPKRATTLPRGAIQTLLHRCVAAQTILLGAVEQGLGGCMIASVNRKGLMAALNIPEHLEILLVIALGKPLEEVRIEAVEPGGDIKYWRDDKGVHHVPKRSLEEIIIERF